MQCLVEITDGWNGDTVKSTVFHDKDVKVLRYKAHKWIAKNRMRPRGNTPYWIMTNVPCEEGVKYISDYGSWSHFGRCTITTEENKPRRKKTMSKKKPYSEVMTAKAIRGTEREAAKILKDCAKKNAPEWYTRLVEEWRVNTTNGLRLYDFLYVMDDEGSDRRFSDKALALNVCDRKLLVKQAEVMRKFVTVLTERIKHGYPVDAPESCKTKCSKCTCKEEVKAEEVKAEEVKDGKKVAKKPTKKAVKKSAK